MMILFSILIERVGYFFLLSNVTLYNVFLFGVLKAIAKIKVLLNSCGYVCKITHT